MKSKKKTSMTTMSKLVVVLSMTAMTGCKVLQTRIDRAYVTADDKTYKYVAPMLLDYIDHDDEKSKDSKAIARKVISSWRRRIDEEMRSWKR